MTRESEYRVTSGDGTRERCGLTLQRAYELAREMARETGDAVEISDGTGNDVAIVKPEGSV